jgi:hypothetical protein
MRAWYYRDRRLRQAIKKQKIRLIQKNEYKAAKLMSMAATVLVLIHVSAPAKNQVMLVKSVYLSGKV